MILNQTQQHIANLDALIVVSAKETGQLYRLKDGKFDFLDDVSEHPPTYSDDEGFFVRSGNGIQMGSGSVKEEDDQYNLEKYIKAIAGELSTTIKTENPAEILILEPEHYKGLIAEHAQIPNNIAVTTLDYGNFTTLPIDELLEKISTHYTKNKLDPSDPESVAGEENAEEKRKILEVGQE